MITPIKLKQPLREELDKLVCPIHHKHGVVADDNGKLCYICCCEEFKEQFIEYFEKSVAKYLF